ncbi:hypothetical protein L289_3183 [Acinetobacter gerneri DSM 14967 = CIP 107464 = MTCC 9824]|nr:hypothetical protein L289_3183 [Acinetobacter gerneri DSM 14967 = CIP 107464 = MTCC 9824]
MAEGLIFKSITKRIMLYNSMILLFIKISNLLQSLKSENFK